MNADKSPEESNFHTAAAGRKKLWEFGSSCEYNIKKQRPELVCGNQHETLMHSKHCPALYCAWRKGYAEILERIELETNMAIRHGCC